jgi:hypothetical protein
LFDAAKAPSPSAQAEFPLRYSITRHGITWAFSKPTRVGQFVNGDYYVVGPVVVTAIDPPLKDGRNGSVVNLPAIANKNSSASADVGFQLRGKRAAADLSRELRHRPALQAPTQQLLPPNFMILKPSPIFGQRLEN